MLKRVLKQVRSATKVKDLPIAEINKIMQAKAPSSTKRSIFAFGTGRAGMRWMTRVFTAHENCNGGCERFRWAEAFYRYVTWNKLPIDNDGFYRLIQQAMYYDWESSGDLSYNASPYYSHGANELLKKYKPNYAFVNLRAPERIVNSLRNKGWFKFTPDYGDSRKNPGIQMVQSSNDFHRNFGRIIPSGKEYKYWLTLSPVGRISWYCSEVARSISSALAKNENVEPFYIKLEEADQSYEYYLKLCNYFNLDDPMCQKKFLQQKGKMGNVGMSNHSQIEWGSKERKDFDENISGYMDLYEKAPDFL